MSHIILAIYYKRNSNHKKIHRKSLRHILSNYDIVHNCVYLLYLLVFNKLITQSRHIWQICLLLITFLHTCIHIVMVYRASLDSSVSLNYLSNATIFTYISWYNPLDKICSLILCIQKPQLEFYLKMSNNIVLKLEQKLLSSLHPWQGLSSNCHRILSWLTPVKSDNRNVMLAHFMSQGKPSISDICYYWMNWWLVEEICCQRNSFYVYG